MQRHRGHRDLKVYQLAYGLAMQVFKHTRTFPEDERYSLTSQIRRSSRSVAANIAEGYRKRQYPNMFASKMADADADAEAEAEAEAEADAEATETQVWLDFARDSGYLSREIHHEIVAQYQEVGRMLSAMISNPDRFVPAKPF